MPSPRSSALSSLGAYLFLALLGAPVLADVVDTTRVDTLIESGAPNLALRLLEQAQAAHKGQPSWYAWERRRLEIYRAQNNWDAIFRRTGNLPSEAPDDFRRWAITLAAEARLP